MSLLLSIVTVTHNRRDKLLAKLTTLAHQTFSPAHFEVIVCVNGSDDGTKEALQQLITPYRLIVICLPENVGPAQGRNACLTKATGDIVYFSDDDCVPCQEVLKKHVKAQRERPGVVIGSLFFDDHIRAQEVSPMPPDVSDLLLSQHFLWQPHKVNYWNCNGSNTSVPRHAVMAVGGFNAELHSYGGEDILLGYLLKRQGLPCYALPDALVWHLGKAPQQATDAAKARSAGYNAVTIAQQYPMLAYRLGVHPIIMAFKHLMLTPPLAAIWQRLSPHSFLYEHAYFTGAQQAQRIRRAHIKGESS